ncbi:chaperonin CPN60-2, mitochondrial [Iris pallida]|uniref:Chaperonin CPN60-2, mitochondrial n=1 Tax=Iris pallida TaxID=29817 RepID=A0AAX6F6Q1_IRIPA|nr:chaperonin CPN60-2, mitochondrial [Iris pallida]
MTWSVSCLCHVHMRYNTVAPKCTRTFQNWWVSVSRCTCHVRVSLT